MTRIMGMSTLAAAIFARAAVSCTDAKEKPAATDEKTITVQERVEIEKKKMS